MGYFSNSRSRFNISIILYTIFVISGPIPSPSKQVIFIYSSSLINLPAGRIIRSQYNLCSILCASQPTERLCTKSGVKRSLGIPSMSYTKPL